MLRQVSLQIIIYNLLNLTTAAGRFGISAAARSGDRRSALLHASKLQTGSVIFFGLRAVLSLTVVDLPMLLARSRRFH
jgi:hypothetical protein